MTDEQRERILDLARRGLSAIEISIALEKRVTALCVASICTEAGVSLFRGRSGRLPLARRGSNAEVRARWVEILPRIKQQLHQELTENA